MEVSFMKRAYFYIDDVIWLFRDLTRQRPASLFDNFMLKQLKKPTTCMAQNSS